MTTQKEQPKQEEPEERRTRKKNRSEGDFVNARPGGALSLSFQDFKIMSDVMPTQEGMLRISRVFRDSLAECGARVPM